MKQRTRMPGLTAEFSLQPAIDTYLSAHRSPHQASTTVAPQMLRFNPLRFGSKDGCIPNCLCVTQEGCPCCDSLLPTTLPKRSVLVR
jgi:hypothetical protein